jgi:hypothetical protein
MSVKPATRNNSPAHVNIQRYALLVSTAATPKNGRIAQLMGGSNRDFFEAPVLPSRVQREPQVVAAA